MTPGENCCKQQTKSVAVMLCRTSSATCEWGQPQYSQYPMLLDQHLFSVTNSRSLGMSTPCLHAEESTHGWMWRFLSTRVPEGGGRPTAVLQLLKGNINTTLADWPQPTRDDHSKGILGSGLPPQYPNHCTVHNCNKRFLTRGKVKTLSAVRT